MPKTKAWPPSWAAHTVKIPENRDLRIPYYRSLNKILKHLGSLFATGLRQKCSEYIPVCLRFFPCLAANILANLNS
jgi:hypothetical protein